MDKPSPNVTAQRRASEKCKKKENFQKQSGILDIELPHPYITGRGADMSKA